MPANIGPPTDAELKTILGPATAVWSRILCALEERFTPLEVQWRPSKAAFGRICLARNKGRTLLYLTPDRGKIWIALVLGERAFNLAMASSVPAAIKKMFADSRPYAEGRGIRYAVDSLEAVPVISKLLEIKTTPKSSVSRASLPREEARQRPKARE
jgi:hypothetical protein